MAEAEKRRSPTEIIDRLKELFTVERVFGDPIEAQGKTIIPVALVGGGGGGGGGESPEFGGSEEEAMKPTGTGIGMGFGFGGSAKPIGVLVVEAEDTKWLPIVDTERIALKGMGIAMAVIKIAGSLAKKYPKKKGRK